MPVKWNKKICIEKITESPMLPSPLEESAGMGGSGQQSRFQQMADRVRQLMGGGKPPEVA